MNINLLKYCSSWNRGAVNWRLFPSVREDRTWSHSHLAFVQFFPHLRSTAATRLPGSTRNAPRPRYLLSRTTRIWNPNVPRAIYDAGTIVPLSRIAADRSDDARRALPDDGPRQGLTNIFFFSTFSPIPSVAVTIAVDKCELVIL